MGWLAEPFFRLLDSGVPGKTLHESSTDLSLSQRLKYFSKSQISNLCFNTVKNSSGFLLLIKYNYITINTYLKSLLKNTTQNYTKLYPFSMNAVYLT